MCSLASSASATSSLSHLTHTNSLPLSPRRCPTIRIISPITFVTRRRHRRLRITAAISDNASDDFSWFSLDYPPIDNFNGWESRETIVTDKKIGFPTFLIAGIGSMAVLLAAFGFFSRSKIGFRIPFRSSFPGFSVPFVTEERKTEAADSIESNEASMVSNDKKESSNVVAEFMTSENQQSEFVGGRQPRVIAVPVDSIQQEALSLLKKLKIIDVDAAADQLCTRREYARWLVRESSLLERNPKYKINKAVALAGSLISAFDDVDTNDQDFDSIQALAEAGVVPSKLSLKYNSEYGDAYFCPERYLSRRDLIDWRAQLEYDFATTGNQEILKTKLGLMDVKETSSDKWPGLFLDMLAGDKSLLRRVFGQIKRLEPNKPSSVAQAAVALASGRMKEAIDNELLRLEAEELLRQTAKEEIKRELLDRGEIQKHWAQKMEEEKAHCLEVQQLYMDALKELEEEKIIQEMFFSGYLKEKAAMDCQKQLLDALKEEVREISEKLVSERGELIGEEETVQTVRRDLQAKMEGILDAKSILEAEIEAIRILRSWIEDEARKSQARWKVLEKVGRRWKWDRQQ